MLQKFYLLLILVCFSGITLLGQSTNTRKWRKSENDSMQSALMMMDDGNYLLALPFYENLYNHHPNEEYLKYCYGKTALSRSDKHEIALKLLSEVYEKNKKVENIEYDLARANHFNYKFDEAIVFIDKALTNKRVSPETKMKARQLKEYCINGKELYSKPTGAKIENMGPVINSPYEDYVPVISADESIMIYTYRGIESTGGLQNEFLMPDKLGKYYEDVFQTVRIDGEWKKPMPIKNVNTTTHDGAIALSPDGFYLFVYRDDGDDHGDIYLSNSLTGEWTVPQKLKGQVNSYSWEGSCSLTADGKHLYFSSERGGGFGGKDIYRATLLPDSTWGGVINLGDSINTALDDDAPFIHPDGVTLFYSSQGKNSIGGYDIFQSKLNWRDSSFSKPVNLGYPINTTDDDIYYVLSANGDRGYYASGKAGGSGLKDIYTVYPGYVGKKPSMYLVKGKIIENGSPVAANIVVEVLDQNNKKFGEFVSNTASGNYLISLPAGGQFKIVYKYKSYPNKTLELNTMNVDGYEEKIFDISFDSKPAELTVKGKTTFSGNPVIAMIDIELFGDSIERKNFGHFKSDSLSGNYVVKLPAGSKYNVVYKYKKHPFKMLDLNTLKLVADEEILNDVEFEEKKVETVKSPKAVATKEPVPMKVFLKPNSSLQEKIKYYSELFGDVTAEGLLFRVQIAAYKYPKNYTYAHLNGLGAVENLLLDDGITRITIGGDFNTLGAAYVHNIKVINAGQKDAFVTVLYKGKRIYLEDLEKMGIFVKK